MDSIAQFNKIIALTVLFATLVATMPVSAAELTPATALGSVSVVGPVDLRGVRITGEGTVFAGDQLHVGAKAYAKVVLVNGHKIELAENSDVTLNQQGQVVQLQLQSGNVAFTSTNSSPLTIMLSGYEITSKKALVGNIAFVGNDFFGVRVVTGDAVIVNMQTKESFSVAAGQERLLSLTAAGSKEPLSQLASSLPSPVPTVPPGPQAAGEKGLSAKGWMTIFGTISGAAAAIAVLATGDDGSESSVSKQQALANLQAMATTAQQTSTVAAATSTVASQANSAVQSAANLSAAQKAQYAAQAQTIASQAQTASQRIATLNATVSQLQSRIGGSSTLSASDMAALDAALADLQAARYAANAALQQLQSLINQLTTGGVQNVPSAPNVVVVPPPAVASISSPA